MHTFAYFREIDGAPMVEVAPHRYVNQIWLDDQRRSAEESRRAAMRRRKVAWRKEQSQEEDEDVGYVPGG